MPAKKTGKPAQGEGNIYPLEDKPKNRCTKWRIVIPLGKLDGKYKQRKETFHGTYTEAHARRREMLIERDGRPWDADATLGEWLDDFNKTRAASGEISQRTQTTDRSITNTIKLHLQDKRFSELTPSTINDFYAKLRNGNSRSKRHLSGTSLHSVHCFLKLALHEPIRKGFVSVDLFDSVIAPKRDTKEKHALSTQAAGTFMSSIDPSLPIHMALLLCVAMGLRRSEALAVMWQDIEFGTLHLKHSVEEDGTLKSPKTAAGRRSLPIPRIVIEAMKIRRRAQRVLAIAMVHGIDYEGQLDEEEIQRVLNEGFPYVCSDSQKARKPHSFSAWWIKHKRKFGVSCTLHELRHTFLTMLARAGVHPRVMQDLAGHASAEITMAIYTHIDIEQKANAIHALDAVFQEETEPPIIEVSNLGDSSNFLPEPTPATPPTGDL